MPRKHHDMPWLVNELVVEHGIDALPDDLTTYHVQVMYPPDFRVVVEYCADRTTFSLTFPIKATCANLFTDLWSAQDKGQHYVDGHMVFKCSALEDHEEYVQTYVRCYRHWMNSRKWVGDDVSNGNKDRETSEIWYRSPTVLVFNASYYGDKLGR